MTPEFIHLHNHSEYSLLDGMLRITEIDGKPSKFLQRLSKEKIQAVAITDHGNMYGAIPFYNNAIKAGVKPIIGCELYITEGDRRDKTKDKFKTGHITALVKDNEGYVNLVEMLSKAYLEGFYYHPRIDFELLEKYNKGIIFLSGCLNSLLGQYILEDKFDKAIEIADKMKSIIGKENFYIELMDHNLADEKRILKPLIQIAEKLGLEPVATNDCHYEHKEDAFAHDVHICISTGALITDKDRMKMETDQLYFKSPQEMYELFKEIPKSLTNTVEIARRCNFKLEKDKIYLPKFDIPKEYNDKFKDPDEAQFQYLKDLCEEGLKEKFGKIPPEYLERLNFELGVIKKMGFSSYFLIVMDFIKYARENGIPVGPGRGSGAGAIVSYALKITKVDPLKHNLLFERFLNPERKSMPDLDIDFSDKGREMVINYVINKYGKENVANIVTYGNIMAKMAIKDVGRVLGFEAAETNKITKMIQSETLAEALNNPDIKKIRDTSENHKKLFEIALKIEGLKRHTGVHAAGKVITDKPVYKYVPLIQREGVVTTQYDGETLTELGLLKIDFLGLRTLSVIQDAVDTIRKKNPDFDIDKIPFDDKKTFELLSEGKTTGVFQLESEGMKKLVKNLKPTAFLDISALVALYRPGPIEAGMIDLFVNRKHGKEKIVYDHPLLEDILKDTYGTIIYQEQVMEIAKKLAGFSPADADRLRKAMGKKIPEEMEKARNQFITGAEKNKIPTKTATKIFDQMYKFAGYGFNKSHTVAYATVSYQTAYLKANYPLEFMVSLLSSEIGHNAIGSEQKENKMVTYINESIEMGFEILPPDVNYSYPKFSIEENGEKRGIRFALTAIKNIGETVAEDIVKERDKKGLYKSLNDFISRNNTKQFNKRVIESLAKAGAFDGLFKEEEKHLKRTKALTASEMDSGSSILSFSSNMLFQTQEEKVLSEHEILKNEKEVLGFYLSGNPLVNFKRIIKMISDNTVSDIFSNKLAENSKVVLSGMISGFKITKTKKSENMCKIELEDLTESVGVTIFPKQFEQCQNNIKSDNIVVVEGVIKKSDFSSKKYEIIADGIWEMFEYIQKKFKSFIIFFEGKQIMTEEMKELKEIKKILETNKDFQGAKVYFV
ncbi:MAG: DNA polymerase III subunit alpha, partial [Elusimicrobiales bacterium]